MKKIAIFFTIIVIIVVGISYIYLNFKSNYDTIQKENKQFESNDKTYNMIRIFNGGISTFTQYYGNIKFKCTNIDYHKKTGRIKYMLFEQTTK